MILFLYSKEIKKLRKYISNAIHTKKRLIPTTRISPKHQITIPKQVFQNLHLEVGDFLDVQTKDNQIIITPKRLITKGQEYFWTEEWQKKEKEAQVDIQNGKVKEFDNVSDLISDLNA